MTFSFEDFISPEEILADVLPAVNDEDFKLLRRGWYLRQIKNGLRKLNYEAPFLEYHIDLAMPSNLILDLPTGIWNIRDIYVWNGENCVISEANRVHHKSNFISNGYQAGYTARNKSGQYDTFINPFQSDTSVLFYNQQNGAIMFSDSCVGYSYVRIVYNGTIESLNSVKFIPPFCREALTGFVVERSFFTLQGRDANYNRLWIYAKQDLYNPLGPMEPSKWDLCIRLMKNLDKKFGDDLKEYLSKMFY